MSADRPREQPGDLDQDFEVICLDQEPRQNEEDRPAPQEPGQNKEDRPALDPATADLLDTLQ